MFLLIEYCLFFLFIFLLSVLYLKLNSIEISNRTLGVCGNQGTYFYNLNTKELVKEYKGLYEGNNFINSSFFVTSYSPELNRVNFYDQNADLIKEIKVSDQINKLISGPLYYQIFEFKKKLFFF